MTNSLYTLNSNKAKSTENSDRHTKSAIFKVEVFWVVTPRCVALSYQRFGGLFSAFIFTPLHGVTTQNTMTSILIAVKTSNVAFLIILFVLFTAQVGVLVVLGSWL